MPLITPMFPDAIWLQVLSNLNIADRMRARRVCTKWNRLIICCMADLTLVDAALMFHNVKETTLSKAQMLDAVLKMTKPGKVVLNADVHLANTIVDNCVSFTAENAGCVRSLYVNHDGNSGLFDFQSFENISYICLRSDEAEIEQVRCPSATRALKLAGECSKLLDSWRNSFSDYLQSLESLYISFVYNVDIFEERGLHVFPFVYVLFVQFSSDSSSISSSYQQFFQWNGIYAYC